MSDITKKTGVVLLLVGIIVAVFLTFGILNYIQTPRAGPVVKESASGGEISLTFEEPLKIEDESAGSLSLTVLPARGDE